MAPPNNKKPKSREMLLGTLLLGLIAVLLFLLLKYTSPEFIIGLLTIIAGFLTISFQYRKAKENEVEARLFLEKAKIYEEIIIELTRLTKVQKGMIKESVNQNELAEKLLDIRSKMIVWSGMEALEAFADLDGIEQGDSLVEVLVKPGNLYAALRKDLGHSDPADAGMRIVTIGLIREERLQIRETLGIKPLR